jgi:DNA-binding transcriptional LysR family regulator
MNAGKQDWDDLRFFLAVALSGSLSGAARSLGVSHSTIFRRIGNFEQQLGVRLFDRLPEGYVLTAVGEEMRDSVTRIEDEIAALSLKVAGQDQRPRGTIRITTTDLLAAGVLPRHVAAFRTEQPGIEIEVVVADSLLDLTRREADVALRIGNPTQETLCRVALNWGHPQFVCHGLTELHRLKGSGRGIEEALGSNQQRGGW